MIEAMEQHQLQRACEELAITPFTSIAFTGKMLDLGLTPSWAAIILDMVMEGAIELTQYPSKIQGRTRQIELLIHNEKDELLISGDGHCCTDRRIITPCTTVTSALKSVLELFHLDPKLYQVRELQPTFTRAGILGEIEISETSYRFQIILSDLEAESFESRFKALGYIWYY
jgi:hypothetical protein